MAMAAAREARGGVRTWRDILFAVLAGLLGLTTLAGILPYALAPWGAEPGGYSAWQTVELHRWHYAQQGGLGVFLSSGILLALARRPRSKLLLIQFLALTAMLILFVNLPFSGPAFIAIVAPLILAILAYPAPRVLLDSSRPGPLSRPLLALTLLAAVLMAPDAWRSLQWQLAGVGGEHAAAHHWVHVVENYTVLIAAGLLASTKRPGWKGLGLLTGAAFLYFGVAALTVPHQDGSWGIVGGVLSLLGGLGYVVATRVEARE